MICLSCKVTKYKRAFVSILVLRVTSIFFVFRSCEWPPYMAISDLPADQPTGNSVHEDMHTSTKRVRLWRSAGMHFYASCAVQMGRSSRFFGGWSHILSYIFTHINKHTCTQNKYAHILVNRHMHTFWPADIMSVFMHKSIFCHINLQ